MFAIIGIFVVIGAVIGGYLEANGNLAVLFQPAELVIIGGAAIGGFLISSPLKVIKLILPAIAGVFKNSGYEKRDYIDVLTLLNSLFYQIRQQGLVSIESDIDAPQKSPHFRKHPKVLHNHHATALITDTIRTVMTTTIASHELEALIDNELETFLEESLQPSKTVNFVAESLPGLGIVAAVLGIVVTMGKMKEPPEVLGQSIGAALVGTFLGVLLCYGFVGPMARNLEHSANEKIQFLNVIKVALVSFLGGSAPKVAVEFGRRVVPANVKPSFLEIETALRQKR